MTAPHARRRDAALATVAVFLAIVLAAGAWAARAFWLPAPGAPGSVEMTVMRGSAIRDVARELQARGVIRGARAFRILARLEGHDRSIQAGNYLLPRGRTPSAILTILVRGDVARSLVTIPEGLRMEAAASIFAREARLDSAAFVRACLDPGLSDSLGLGRSGLEGFLFPQTYSVLVGSPAREIAVRMAHLAEREYDAAAAEHAPPDAMTARDVMTLASIVQAEAKFDQEMPRIAAVFYNRFRVGWRLEADPTVQYALGAHRTRVLYGDLAIDSPYNTYLYAGLPPGPICSPGRAAIRAALAPAPGEQSLYFVARRDGTHVFSSRLEDHERARAAVKREER